MKYGVYIDKDIEVIITDLYMIIYRRNNEEDFLESRLYKRVYSTWSCLGICRSSPVCSMQRTPPKVWKYAFCYNGELQSSHNSMKNIIGTAPVILEQEKDNIKITLEDSIIYKCGM